MTFSRTASALSRTLASRPASSARGSPAAGTSQITPSAKTTVNSELPIDAILSDAYATFN